MRNGYRSEYEKAFFKFLHLNKIPVIPTNEARKSVSLEGEPIKSFDFLTISEGLFALDIKGRSFGFKSCPGNKYENYIQTGDAEGLIDWESVFKGSGIEVNPLLVFMFKIIFEGDEKEFKDIIDVDGTKYGVLAIRPDEYLKNSKPRSKKFKAICVSRRLFKDIAVPLSTYMPNVGL